MTWTFRNSLLVGASLAVAIAFAFSGCGGGGEEEQNGEQAASPEAGGTPAPSVEMTIPQGATGVTGKVVFTGPRPERKELETEGDPKCYQMHLDDPLLSDREVVGPNGGVQYSFVYIKNPPDQDYPVPDTPAELDQIGCRYVPHVLGVQVGQQLEYRSSDPTLHNVRAIARENDPYNLSLPVDFPPRVKVFDKPEMAIRIKCDVHPWMTAFVFAMPHPYFATTNEKGEFAITGLPAGTYTVVAWHEAYGEKEAQVTVKDGAMSQANFSYTPEDRGEDE